MKSSIFHISRFHDQIDGGKNKVYLSFMPIKRIETINVSYIKVS